MARAQLKVREGVDILKFEASLIERISSSKKSICSSGTPHSREILYESVIVQNFCEINQIIKNRECRIKIFLLELYNKSIRKFRYERKNSIYITQEYKSQDCKNQIRYSLKEKRSVLEYY